MAVIFSIFSKAGARCNMASHLLLEVIYVPSVFASNVVSWAPDSREGSEWWGTLLACYPSGQRNPPCFERLCLAARQALSAWQGPLRNVGDRCHLKPVSPLKTDPMKPTKQERCNIPTKPGVCLCGCLFLLGLVLANAKFH